ncbi:MAG: hypothetical protein QGG36_27240 [Pirellulaceae bacterium]|nr:hypothetical protein [Pirellulaceae bacterium]MDP7019522.1 hypothetical protein [Pirellulaceae bacterium]
MNTRIPKSLVALLACLLVVAAAPLQAQQKPAAVISIAGVDEIMGDIGYVAEAVGAGDAAGLVRFVAGQYTQHLDGTKPSGVVVSVDAGIPQALGFLPIKDLNALLAQTEEQLGQAEDLGNGVFKINGPQPVFLKKSGAWVFVSNAAETLATAPADPVAALGDLPTKYDIGVQVNVQSIPAPLRQQAVQEMTKAFEASLEQQAAFAPDPAQAEMQAKLGRNAIKQLTMMIQETDTVSLGLSVDSDKKHILLDMSITAAEGTKLAGQMNLLKGLKTRFGGFNMPGSAATLSVTSKLTKEEIEQNLLMIQAMHTKAQEEIDKDDSLPDAQAKETVKNVLASLVEVATKTIEKGESDGGAVLLLNEQSGVQFAAGGYIADGAALDQAFRSIVELGKNEPDFPEVKFDAANHAGVTFHTMSMPIPTGDEDVRKALGDTIHVVLGTGQESVYVAFGQNSIDLIKKVIDASQDPSPGKPLNLQVSATPILEFAVRMSDGDPNIKRVLDAVKESGNRDKLQMTVGSVDRGISLQVKVDEGLLNLAPKPPAEEDGF